MSISVVIPTRGSSPHLVPCLESLVTQTHKPDEIIVVFGNSDDKNVELVPKYNARYVFDKNNSIGGAYASGANAAKSDIVAFMDDDCLAPSDWIEKVEQEFKEDIDVFGGEDILPNGSTFFQRAVYQIDKARMIKTSVYGKKACNRLRAANIAYRKKIFINDNFDAKLTGLQEPEFHYRLFRKGLKMKFNPNIFVYHKRRSSLKNIFSQIYRNGKAKIDLVRRHGDMLSFIDMVPFAFVFYSAIMAYLSVSITRLFFFAWIGSIVAYFLLKTFVVVAKTRGFKYYFHLFAIILTREIAYGLGILRGFPKLFKR